MKRSLTKHFRIHGGSIWIRPAGGGPDVTIPLASIQDVKLPFGRIIVRTDHSRHELDVTNCDLKEYDQLRDLLLEAERNNRRPNNQIDAYFK